MPHAFSRSIVHDAREKARSGTRWRYAVPIPVPCAWGFDRGSITAEVPPAWEAVQILAADHEDLERGCEALLRVVALLEDMTQERRCPICGGLDMFEGTAVRSALVRRFGLEPTLRHKQSCPLLQARANLVRLLEGDHAAEQINKMTVVLHHL